MGVDNIIGMDEEVKTENKLGDDGRNSEKKPGTSGSEGNEQRVRPVYDEDIKIDSDGQIMILSQKVFIELLKNSSIKKISELIRAKHTIS